MTPYKPEQRDIAVRILTTAGWLSGHLHVPARSRLVEQLNRPTVFFGLTDVTLHARQARLPFLALHRNEMILVLPPDSETDLQHVPETEALASHQITCLLDAGTISATMKTLKGLRVSDFFLNRQGFVLLEGATLQSGGWDGRPATEDRHSRVIINSSRVLGIADMADMGPHDGE